MSTSPNDSDNFCIFAFADGRRCTMLPAPASEYGLCYFHHQQYIERLNKQYAGEQICNALAIDINTACDLSVAFTKLFRATALGHIKPKTAHTLTYLGHLMLQTHQLAKQEYESTFEKSWPDLVADSVCFRENLPPATPPAKPVYPPDPPDPDSDADSAPTQTHEPNSAQPVTSSATLPRSGTTCCAPGPQDPPEQPPAPTTQPNETRDKFLEARPDNPDNDPASIQCSGGLIPPSCSSTNPPSPPANPPQHSQIETPPQPILPTTSPQAAALLAAHLQHLLRLYYFDQPKRAQT